MAIGLIETANVGIGSKYNGKYMELKMPYGVTYRHGIVTLTHFFVAVLDDRDNTSWIALNIAENNETGLYVVPTMFNPGQTISVPIGSSVGTDITVHRGAVVARIYQFNFSEVEE